MGTKLDPGEYDCYEKAKPDEPMFILLARDPIAPILVELWVELRCLLDKCNGDKADEAIRVADDMRTYYNAKKAAKELREEFKTTID